VSVVGAVAADPRVLLSEPMDQGRCAVGAGVVDHQNLVVDPRSVQRLHDASNYCFYRTRLVVRRDDDGELTPRPYRAR
jgi:hypothetical protein